MKKYNLDTISINFKLFLGSIVFIHKAYLYKLFKKHYRSFVQFCWLSRISNISMLKKAGQKNVSDFIKDIHKKKENYLLKSFRADSSSSKYTYKYSITGIGKQDIFRDIIVLKSPLHNEKGVILLKYAVTFEAFLYFFNVEKLLHNYKFILELCWAGAYNSNILMWNFPDIKNQIFVQCFTNEDYDTVSYFKPYLIPIRLGPADWVDSDKFTPNTKKNKNYDLIMVANWAKIKRHDILFKALNKIRHRKVNVLLIGYELGGRSIQDIKREAESIINNKLIDIHIKENLSHFDVAKNLNDSKIFIFLTAKEGDNKAIVEAMFTDVPVIVYKDTVGGASSRVNKATGILSSYEDLDKNIIYMLDNYKNFSPRK